MSEHRCHCTVCDPGAFPDWIRSAERIHDGHYGVRFGDHRHLRVFLDDEELKVCSELVLGDPGEALVYCEDEDGHRHRCRECWSRGVDVGACMMVIRGNLTVRPTAV